MMRSSQLIARTLLVPAFLGAGFLAHDTAAQSGRRMMIMNQSDSGGEESSFSYVSMPDIRAIREPDYRRTDYPTFEEKLRLDEAQRLVVKSLFEGYLAEFSQLVHASAPEPVFQTVDLGDGQGSLQVDRGDHEHTHDHAHAEGHGEGETISDLLSLIEEAHGEGGGGEPGATMDIAIGAGSAPGGVAMPPPADGEEGTGFQMIAVATSGDGEEGADGAAGGEGTPGVVIGISTANGQEIPAELREKLEARAQEIAEQMAERIRNGEEIGAEGLGGVPEFSMEDHQARMQAIADKARAFEKSKEALRKQFILDIQGQLTGDQLDCWIDLERTLVRRKTLPDGRLDGEKTDLVQLVEETPMTLAERDAIAESLAAYEIDLHAALVQRNEFIPEAQSRIDEAMRTRRYERALSSIDRAADLRTAVRGVNDRYLELFAEQVEADTADTLRTTYRETSFPEIYRETRAMKAFARARTLPDLDPAYDELIDGLEEAYEFELLRINDTIERAIRKHQPSESRRTIERIAQMAEEGGGMAFQFGGDPDDPIRVAYDKRKALDEKYMKRLYDQLPEEQITQLPKLPSEVKPNTFFFRQGE